MLLVMQTKKQKPQWKNSLVSSQKAKRILKARVKPSHTPHMHIIFTQVIQRHIPRRLRIKVRVRSDISCIIKWVFTALLPPPLLLPIIVEADAPKTTYVCCNYNRFAS